MSKEFSTSRRNVLKTGLAAVAAVATARLATAPAHAADLPELDEADPQAMALGYKHDTTQVDAAKFPAHTAEQLCSNCQLYQPIEGSEWGKCPIFAGKQVAANGWCSAYVKKA